MVVAAIDALAELMIRRPDYFWDRKSSPGADASIQRYRLSKRRDCGRGKNSGADAASEPLYLVTVRLLKAEFYDDRVHDGC